MEANDDERETMWFMVMEMMENKKKFDIYMCVYV